MCVRAVASAPACRACLQVQLRNPWGMKEWTGPWSDGSREWETAVGRKAMERLNVTFGNDGTFWMAWEDFQAHFNKIYVRPISATRAEIICGARAEISPRSRVCWGCATQVCRIFDTVPGTSLLRGQRPALGQWCRYEIEGAWDDSNSGGCFNFPEWRKNPQYEIITTERIRGGTPTRD